MVKEINKNKIYAEYFGSLETESLKIDYLRFNLKSYLHDSEIQNLAVYFRRLGFSSYKKERDKNKERTAIFNDKYSEVTFILYTTYHDGTHLEFAGKSANQLYFYIKSNKFNWNQLEKYGAFLRRIDTCYDRPQKSTDKVTNETFLEATIRHLKTNFPNNNLEYKRNRSGELIKVGHITNDKYYRVYLKGQCLRFEFEHKHRKTLNLYGNFLKTKQFRQLEQRISYEFLKQTQHLFRYSQETEKVEWLAQRLRPFQTIIGLAPAATTINIHYMDQCPMKKLQKQDLIRLFQLLAYLKSLDSYKIANLRSKFRQYQFPVREFLYFANPTTEVNQYQLGKTIDFFNSLEHNLVFKFLADKDYRMLVTIPEASATKVQNQWIAEVWVANEIFNYFEPFLFTDYFKQNKMTVDEFSVLFHIIQRFSVNNLRKDFDILRFYPSKLNGTRKKKIKDLFLRYIKKLQQEGKIQEQVLFPLQSESNPNRLINISDLNAQHLVEPFVIFEVLQVSFVE
uniref:Uncharacterized protein n=1 Tax=Heterosigma akashiwo TaxID=2829 RepID=B2XT35_HETAK|nr:hypothetical protein Heak293_Cp026 [Heterosigma akashiwo]ABV65933.1 conserved hypothetical protein [Heterosigma akashiwo]